MFIWKFPSDWEIMRVYIICEFQDSTVSLFLFFKKVPGMNKTSLQPKQADFYFMTDVLFIERRLSMI